MPPNTHQVAPTIITANKKVEVFTANKGVESDTGNFVHPDSSSILLESEPLAASDAANDRIVMYDGSVVGYIRTGTAPQGAGSTVSLVKMHLVNSYLHPEANKWGGNWFWGSIVLNKKHSEFEELAKKNHPATIPAAVPAVSLLRYQTEVGTQRPAVPDINEFTAIITAELLTHKNQSGGDATAAIDSAKVTIGNKTIAAFHALWVAAVAAHGYSSFKAEFACLVGAAWSGVTYSADGNSKVVGEKFIPSVKSLNSDAWMALFPIESRGTDSDGNRRSKRQKT